MLGFGFHFPWFKTKPATVNEVIPEEPAPAWIIIDIERLVLWESPCRTWISLLATYILLGCVYWAARQPVYSLSLFAMAIFSRDLWKNYIWPEISVPQSSPPTRVPIYRVNLSSRLQDEWQRFQTVLHQRCQRLLQLRSTNPLLFCGVVSVAWLSLAFIGTLVPGWFCAVLLPLALFVMPRWFIQGLPPYLTPVLIIFDTVFSLVEKQLGISTHDSVDVLEEFLPTLEEADLLCLEKAVNLTESPTDTPGDEIGLPSQLPLEDLDESDQEVKELEEHIRLRSLKQLSQEEDTISDDLEEEFSHGLSFTTPPADPRLTQPNVEEQEPGLMSLVNVALTKAAAQSSLYNMVAVGQSLLTNYLQSPQEEKTDPKETEEGFEIISESDLID